jgi:hypothetical protein
MFGAPISFQSRYDLSINLIVTLRVQVDNYLVFHRNPIQNPIYKDYIRCE